MDTTSDLPNKESILRKTPRIVIGIILLQFIAISLLVGFIYIIRAQFEVQEKSSEEYIMTLKKVIDENEQSKKDTVDAPEENTDEEVGGFRVQIDPDENGFFIYSENITPRYYKRITAEDILGTSNEKMENGASMDFLGWGNISDRPKYWGFAYILHGKSSFFAFDVKTRSVETFDGSFLGQEWLLNKDSGKVAYSNAWQSFSMGDIAPQDKMLSLRINDLTTSKNVEVISVPSEGVDDPFFAPVWISTTQLKYTNPQTGQEERYELKGE